MAEERLATCPRCQTRFTVGDAQLAAANGLVRCGNCLQVFSAITGEVAFVAPAVPQEAPNFADLQPKPMADAALPRLQARKRPRSGWVLLALLLLLAVQLAVPRHTSDSSKELSLVALAVRPHPETPAALRVDAVLRNGGDSAQPYPGLVLEFTNRHGEPRARRTFLPTEYLHGGSHPDTLPPRSEVQISLSLQNPGADAVNYVAGLASLP